MQQFHKEWSVAVLCVLTPAPLLGRMHRLRHLNSSALWNAPELAWVGWVYLAPAGRRAVCCVDLYVLVQGRNRARLNLLFVMLLLSCL